MRESPLQPSPIRMFSELFTLAVLPVHEELDAPYAFAQESVAARDAEAAFGSLQAEK